MVGILAMATSIVAVTNGVVQAIKRTEKVNRRYLPLLAIVVGILLGAAAVFIEIDLVSRLWAGGISGLAAVGLFEIGKNVVEGDE